MLDSSICDMGLHEIGVISWFIGNSYYAYILIGSSLLSQKCCKLIGLYWDNWEHYIVNLPGSAEV